MIRLVLRPRARRDLADIWLYTADKWGVDRAEDYTSAINRDIEQARDFPNVGSPVEGLPLGYRKLASGKHRIIYRTSETELIVVRIIHERQDVPDDLDGL